MEIIGRITRHAEVTSTPTGKQVVHFDVAVNERYKDRASGEYRKITTYFKCSYWRGTAVAKLLVKGTVVQVEGRPGVSAYIGRDGKPAASLTVNVRTVNVHTQGAKAKATEPAPANQETDDLPF